MLVQWLFDAALFGLQALLDLIDVAMPSDLLNVLDGAAGGIAALLSWGPLGIVSTMFLTYLALDFMLDAVFFARNTYKLIPAKAT
jgi:hypothetical protein